MRYQFTFASVRHPRPLACGIWSGSHREFIGKRIFKQENDGAALMEARHILNPYPRSIETPGRTMHSVKLVEIDKSGNEIRIVKDWNYKRCIFCGGKPFVD